MTPGDLVALLDPVPELRLNAVRLLAELAALESAGQLNSARLADCQRDLEKALGQIDAYVAGVEKVVKQCTQLPAIPSPCVPPGF